MGCVLPLLPYSDFCTLDIVEHLAINIYESNNQQSMQDTDTAIKNEHNIIIIVPQFSCFVLFY